MKLSEALRYRAAIEKASASLSDGELLEVHRLAPVWSPEKEYEAGDRVTYQAILYRCLQSHTAQSDWAPVAAPSLWTKVLIPEEDVIPEWEQPDSTNPYGVGDRVRHNGKVWVSVVENNTWEPGIYGWEEAE